jgi:hypothetical protein
MDDRELEAVFSYIGYNQSSYAVANPRKSPTSVLSEKVGTIEQGVNEIRASI